MPTIFSHAVAALAVGPALPHAVRSPRLWALAAFCAVAPDLDVVAFRFGIPYEHPLGHRGASHSLAFAALLAAALGWLFYRRSAHRAAVGAFLFAATASHALLDMLTDGGLGVALFAPVSNARLFFPWRPIEVSPFGAGIWSARGVEVLLSELAWVWAPSAVLAFALLLWRRRRRA